MTARTALDVIVDLNTMDDTGLPWAFLDRAVHPERLVPGAYVIVGSGQVRAVAQVIDVVEGIVQFGPCGAPLRPTRTCWSGTGPRRSEVRRGRAMRNVLDPKGHAGGTKRARATAAPFGNSP